MATSAAVTTSALGTGDLATVGTVSTLVLVLIGAVLCLIITKLIARVIVIVIVVVLAVLVWQQRSHVEDKIKNDCQFGATYFGIHIDAPQSVKDRCAQVGQTK